MAGMTPLVKTKDAQLIFTREDDMIYYLYVYKATHTHTFVTFQVRELTGLLSSTTDYPT